MAHEHEDRVDDKEPWQQRILDNLWLLLALGTVIPAVIYLLWGLWELSQVPLWGGG